MKWMLDTDTCIAVIRARPASVLKRLRTTSIGQVGISSITLAELSYGAAKSLHRAQAENALAEFLMPLEVAPFDAGAASAYGGVRAHLSTKGQTIGPLDTLIGSHALAAGSILVTHNTREFARVPGLRLEDWMVAGA